MSTFFSFLLRPAVVIGILAVVAVGLGAVYFLSGVSEPADLVAVRRGTIIQEVSVTGKVKPSESVELAFERSGRVRAVRADVGDAVTAGQALVELDQSELLAQLREAEASSAVQRAKLEELKRGSRPEDIQVKQAELAKARQDLENLYTGTPNVLNDVHTKADDAARAKTAGIFSGSKTTFYALTFSACDDQARIDATSGRLAADALLDAWRAELDAISALSKREELEAALRKAEGHLAQIKSFLDDLNDVLTAGCTLNNSSLDTYRTNVNTGRANINTALTNVKNREEEIASQKATVSHIERELELKLAGTTKEEIAAQEAQVRQTEAGAELVRAQLAKTVLRASFAGIVTKQDAKVGQIVAANQVLAAVISRSRLEIEANVPEADVAKIKVGDAARVTLDAYGDETFFAARIAAIDPAETVVEGVSTYRTTLEFEAQDERIKSGMTANIDIAAARKEGVVVVPSRLVAGRDGERFVRVYLGGERFEERQVTVGLRGSDGMLEIVSGLQEGELVAPAE